MMFRSWTHTLLDRRVHPVKTRISRSRKYKYQEKGRIAKIISEGMCMYHDNI
jgi:hypothetical protein